jgi:selenocysteine lyase/cysteine desulfurase
MLPKLRRPWFAGGTISTATVQGDWYVMAEGEAAFEDGTINYLNLPAVEIGLKHLTMIGMATIHERITCLTSWLLDTLQSLYHNNGVPLVRIYGPHNTYRRGGTIALNFLMPDGHIVDERIIDRRAARYGLSLRTGCFCNPGAGEAAFGVPKQELIENIQDKQKMAMDEYLAALGLKSAGAVRVSLGLVSNFADVYRFVQFAETFLDTFPTESDLLPRMHC